MDSGHVGGRVMLKQVMKKAYQKVEDKLDHDQPNLIVLRGFTEVIHHFPVPEHWEHWQEGEMVDSGIYYLLAEEFQVLMMNFDLYLKVMNNQLQQGLVSFGNIVDDESLEMELFAIGLAYVDGELGGNFYSDKILEMFDLDVNFQTLDFNLFEVDDDWIGNDYFPINYEISVGNDYEYFYDLNYYGLLNPQYHGQGLVSYYDFDGFEENETVKVFDTKPAYQVLGFEMTSEEDDLAREEFISDSFFHYLSKINILN